MKVKHGHVEGNPALRLHLEFCPDCDDETRDGEHIVIVGYDCPHCAARQQQPAESCA